MRRVFSTPTFYTSFHYTARLLVTVIKAYWRLLSCRKQVPSPLPFPRSRANEFDFPLKVKKILQKRKRKEKKIFIPDRLSYTHARGYPKSEWRDGAVGSSRTNSIVYFSSGLVNGVHVLMKFDSAVVRCLNQCQTFYSTNWTRLVTDTVLMRHRRRGGKGDRAKVTITIQRIPGRPC